MSWIFCAVCEDNLINSKDDPACWCGPNQDIPVCERCRYEEASYENQAHPMPKYHSTGMPRGQK